MPSLTVIARQAIAQAQAQLDTVEARQATGTLTAAASLAQTVVIVLNLQETLRRPITETVWQLQHTPNAPDPIQDGAAS